MTIEAVAEGDSLPNHFYGRLLRKTLAYATRTKGQLQAVLRGSEFWSISRLAGRSRWSIEITAVSTSHWKESSEAFTVFSMSLRRRGVSNGVSERLNRLCRAGNACLRATSP